MEHETTFFCLLPLFCQTSLLQDTYKTVSKIAHDTFYEPKVFLLGYKLIILISCIRTLKRCAKQTLETN
jgi:hypothetical protein